MRILSTSLTLVALLGLAACENPNSMNHPTDTGSMQLPNTSGTGTQVTPPTGRDVGSMAAPSGSGGVLTRTQPSGSRAPTDTGSMALPPGAQGNSLPHRP